MIAMSQEQVTARARALRDALGAAGELCELLPGRSMIGGGSLPQESLPTTLLALPAERSVSLAVQLRAGDPAIVARLQDEHLVIDLRTVLPHEEAALAKRLMELLQSPLEQL
jgi:L-seryl-tRNA(Ser) seleniumtransferase